MKTTTLYFNQRTRGGAVEWEKWQPSNIEKENFKFGSGKCLRAIEIEISDDWKIGNSGTICDSNGNIVHFKSDCDDIDGDIYAMTSESPFPQQVKIIAVKEWYPVIDDERGAREAFVVDEERAAECLSNYSGYYIVREFETEAEANAFCEAYNNYELEKDKPVECHCCSEGCTMSAYEYGHWNGGCAYKGT